MAFRVVQTGMGLCEGAGWRLEKRIAGMRVLLSMRLMGRREVVDNGLNDLSREVVFMYQLPRPSYVVELPQCIKEDC
jgi:hypothetical protein